MSAELPPPVMVDVARVLGIDPRQPLPEGISMREFVAAHEQVAEERGMSLAALIALEKTEQGITIPRWSESF